MKILWVTNVMIGELCDHLNVKHPASGGWMEALLKDFELNDTDKIVVISTDTRKELKLFEKGNIKYYMLPCGNISKFNHRNSRNLSIIGEILKKEKPDLIHVWGTEFTLGLAFLKCGVDIPSLIYIQGVLKSIARYYEAGMSKNELSYAVTIRDILKRDGILTQKKKYLKKSKFEKEIISISGNIVSENNWCKIQCESIYEEVITYNCQLNLRDEFRNYRWDLRKSENFTIMCNASGYPIKGLHMLIKALEIVVKKYKNVILYVPGPTIVLGKGVSNYIRQTGYSKYLRRLIREKGLENNVRFLGILPPALMAEYMSSVRAFVVPSVIENHSSTLKEAMLVGTPCISSYVGGVPEYMISGFNGILYRFEEYEMLAKALCDIFENDNLSLKLSENARATILKKHTALNIFENMKSIYKAICLEGN